MIHFYGSPMSSSGRTHLMLEEAGVPYEYHRVTLRDPAQKAAFLEVHPGGKIPYLVDGDVRLAESVAINFYLAEKYKPEMWASSVEERAAIFQWSLWGISTLQPEALRVLHHAMIVPAESRSAYEVETGKKNVARLLEHLERTLPADGFLAGGRFTVADVNVASAVNLATAMCGAKLGERAGAWFAACKARPAWQKILTAG
ncbi:MAG: glutathione S-transferase family protein [Deltaproteobacteria bacterium]|nr:glutathione S-transferase family protein [Deltaproteobacteria bacterium]